MLLTNIDAENNFALANDRKGCTLTGFRTLFFPARKFPGCCVQAARFY